MARISDSVTFNTAKHVAEVAEMRERRETVHAKGEEVFRRTGRMDPLVSVMNAYRDSKFAWTRNEDGTFTLAKGFKRPNVVGTDGTGSFGEQVAKAFLAAPKINAMLEIGSQGNWMNDFSFCVFQDRDDPHGPLQFPQFESDNRFAEHMRLLVPDMTGGDIPEDYDLGLYFTANRVRSTLFRYGGKGLFVMLLDAPGRGRVESHLVRNHLGIDMQNDVQTKDVWQKLLTKFHAFVVVLGSVSSANWWQPVVGQGRMVVAPSSELLAEVQSGLAYATDVELPTEAGLYEFLRAGGSNSGISKSDARSIWSAYVTAGVPFGAGWKLNSKLYLPKAGDIFASMTDMYPIGHPRATENAAPAYDAETPTDPEPPAHTPKPNKWTLF